jgi:hypothetical protein
MLKSAITLLIERKRGERESKRESEIERESIKNDSP